MKCQAIYASKCKEKQPKNIPEISPVNKPVPQSTWDTVQRFAQKVAERGMDAEKAAEQFLKDNPTLVWSIIIVGVIGIIALIADDLTVAGIADDVLIPIVAGLLRVAWRLA